MNKNVPPLDLFNHTSHLGGEQSPQLDDSLVTPRLSKIFEAERSLRKAGGARKRWQIPSKLPSSQFSLSPKNCITANEVTENILVDSSNERKEKRSEDEDETAVVIDGDEENDFTDTSSTISEVSSYTGISSYSSSPEDFDSFISFHLSNLNSLNAQERNRETSKFRIPPTHQPEKCISVKSNPITECRVSAMINTSPPIMHYKPVSSSSNSLRGIKKSSINGRSCPSDSKLKGAHTYSEGTYDLIQKDDEHPIVRERNARQPKMRSRFDEINLTPRNAPAMRTTLRGSDDNVSTQDSLSLLHRFSSDLHQVAQKNQKKILVLQLNNTHIGIIDRHSRFFAKLLETSSLILWFDVTQQYVRFTKSLMKNKRNYVASAQYLQKEEIPLDLTYSGNTHQRSETQSNIVVTRDGRAAKRTTATIITTSLKDRSCVCASIERKRKIGLVSDSSTQTSPRPDSTLNGEQKKKSEDTGTFETGMQNSLEIESSQVRGRYDQLLLIGAEWFLCFLKKHLSEAVQDRFAMHSERFTSTLRIVMHWIRRFYSEFREAPVIQTPMFSTVKDLILHFLQIQIERSTSRE